MDWAGVLPFKEGSTSRSRTKEVCFRDARLRIDENLHPSKPSVQKRTSVHRRLRSERFQWQGFSIHRFDAVSPTDKSAVRVKIIPDFPHPVDSESEMRRASHFAVLVRFLFGTCWTERICKVAVKILFLSLDLGLKVPHVATSGDTTDGVLEKVQGIWPNPTTSDVFANGWMDFLPCPNRLVDKDKVVDICLAYLWITASN